MMAEKAVCSHLELAGAAAEGTRPYPSHRHRCIIGGRSLTVAPHTQAIFCLTGRHEECPLFPAGRLPIVVEELPTFVLK